MRGTSATPSPAPTIAIWLASSTTTCPNGRAFAIAPNRLDEQVVGYRPGLVQPRLAPELGHHYRPAVGQPVVHVNEHVGDIVTEAARNPAGGKGKRHLEPVVNDGNIDGPVLDECHGVMRVCFG